MALIQLDRFLQLARKESPAKYRNRSDLLLDDRTKGIFNTRQQAQRWSDLKYEHVVTQCFGAWGQADSSVDTQRREKGAKFVDEKYSALEQFTVTFDPSRFHRSRRLHRSLKKTKMSVKTARGKVSSVKLVSKWFYSVYMWFLFTLTRFFNTLAIFLSCLLYVSGRKKFILSSKSPLKEVDPLLKVNI